MDNAEMVWEPVRVRGASTAGPRQALFYRVKHGGMTYRVMLGVDEQGCCELFEHVVEHRHVRRANPHIYAHKMLPYVQERLQRGAGSRQFANLDLARAHVEGRIREFEAAQEQA